MEWIKVSEKKPPLYKEVLLFLNNKVIVNGCFTEAGPDINQHVTLKHYVGYDPETTTVVYWCEEPKFPDE